MKVYNQDKTQELTSYDLTKGYLQEDYIIIGKRASLEETVENEDGTSSTTIYPTLDITETCFVYIPYTTQELKEREIAHLKENLKQTDYRAIKYAEGFISEEDYAAIKAQRQQWRDTINELEGSMGGQSD